MKNKWIIGVDSALRNTAYTVMDNMGNRVETYNIRTKTGTADWRSIDFIVKEFFERLERYLTPPAGYGRPPVSVFIEDIKYTRVGDKTHARAELIGTIKWLLRQERINIYGVDPGAANSFLDGRFGLEKTMTTVQGKKVKRNRDAQKAHTKAVVHRYCNFYTRDDNEADSYVMALLGYAKLIEKQHISTTPMCEPRY